MTLTSDHQRVPKLRMIQKFMCCVTLHNVLANTRVKNEWNCASTSLYSIMTRTGTTSLLLFQKNAGISEMKQNIASFHKPFSSLLADYSVMLSSVNSSYESAVH